MDKTLHKKLTGKTQLNKTHAVTYANGDFLPTVFVHEMEILQEAAKDLMQPRAIAIADLLKKAREI